MKLIDWLILAAVALICIWGIRAYRKNPCSGCGRNCETCVIRKIEKRSETL